MIEIIRNVLILKENANGKYDVMFSVDGTNFKKIGEITNFKSLVVNPLNLIPVDVGNYSDGTTAFVKYTPPSDAEEGTMRVAIDTGSPGGKRLYIYANGEWHYVDLS